MRSAGGAFTLAAVDNALVHGCRSARDRIESIATDLAVKDG